MQRPSSGPPFTLEEDLPCAEIFNPLKLPGLVGEELEDFVDLGVDSWLLGVPLTGDLAAEQALEWWPPLFTEAGDLLRREGPGLLDPEYLTAEERE